MIDLKQKEKEIIRDFHLSIINKINECFDNKRAFKLQDLLEEDKKNYYYIYLAKGILILLLMLEYLEIFSLYNGNKNFLYKVRRRIVTKFNKKD